MEIIDLENKTITVTDLEAALLKAESFKNMHHVPMAEGDKDRMKYWNDIYYKLLNIKLQQEAAQYKERLAALGIESAKLSYEQLVCIGARINGEWDNKELLEFGLLMPDIDEDIKRIAMTFKPLIK